MCVGVRVCDCMHVGGWGVVVWMLVCVWVGMGVGMCMHALWCLSYRNWGTSAVV